MIESQPPLTVLIVLQKGCLHVIHVCIHFAIEWWWQPPSFLLILCMPHAPRFQLLIPSVPFLPPDAFFVLFNLHPLSCSSATSCIEVSFGCNMYCNFSLVSQSPPSSLRHPFLLLLLLKGCFLTGLSLQNRFIRTYLIINVNSKVTVYKMSVEGRRQYKKDGRKWIWFHLLITFLFFSSNDKCRWQNTIWLPSLWIQTDR